MICIDLAYLEAVRSEELEQVKALLPKACTILDFGAGPGHQALRLQQAGFEVKAVDLGSSQYLSSKVFPVQEYDGKHLPFASEQFDAVYSSNVLEHVVDLQATLKEMQRVLRPGGVMVHVLPSASWRLWSSLAEFVSAPRNAVRSLRADRSTLKFKNVLPGPLASIAEASARLIRPVLLMPHGESASAVLELYTFSRLAWSRRFRHLGFEVRQVRPMKLFYTGEMLFGSRLSFVARRRLAKGFGSSTIMWLITPAAMKDG